MKRKIILFGFFTVNAIFIIIMGQMYTGKYKEQKIKGIEKNCFNNPEAYLQDVHIQIAEVKTEEKKENQKIRKFIPIDECLWNKREQKLIWKICYEEKYSFELCIAQAKLESSWEKKAIGDGGKAKGAWQIHPMVWIDVIQRLGYEEKDMFQLEKACRTYIYIMKSHFQKFDDVEFALLAWRWGGDRAMDMIDCGEYSDYSADIIRLAQKYERRK